MQETDLVKQVEELQKTVAALEFKAQITSRLFRRVGLDRFFGEREFWENIIDVGQSECSERCSQTFAATNAAIAANQNYSDAERAAAYKEAADTVTLCHQRCQQQFPNFP